MSLKLYNIVVVGIDAEGNWHFDAEIQRFASDMAAKREVEALTRSANNLKAFARMVVTFFPLNEDLTRVVATKTPSGRSFDQWWTAKKQQLQDAG